MPQSGANKIAGVLEAVSLSLGGGGGEGGGGGHPVLMLMLLSPVAAANALEAATAANSRCGC